MTQGINKKNSIYVQLFRLLVVAALLSFLVFRALDSAGIYMIDKYLYNSTYREKKDRAAMDDFQRYVKQEQITTGETEALSSWVRKQKNVSIYIYKDGIQVFNSDYPEQEVSKEEITLSDYETYYTVEFADGDAQVSILAFYDYQLYNYELVASILLAFAMFLFLVLFGIRKKMRYITMLSEEIEILEGGSLDYPVTVKGKDELAALAEGLDHMRLSFLEIREREAQMVQKNQRIVTEMSHDLRTPVTSIILYTEILKKGKNLDEAQQKKYMDIIEKKAYRMKQLTDHLFEYSLTAGSEEIQLEEPEVFEIIFYDIFSETCSYLEQKGFQVDFQVEWSDEKIRISEDYVMRIMDNITSNLLKYADAAFPLILSSVREENFIGFSVENHVRRDTGRTESTGIGIQNIKNMMEKMHGKCGTERKGESFRLTLLFPVI